MTTAIREQSFDAKQLGLITRSCKRWMAIESLPEPLSRKLEELDRLSLRLLAQSSGKEDGEKLLAFVRNSCQSLRNEFAKIQVAFDCPSCPLRAS